MNHPWILLLLLTTTSMFAQGPEVTSWIVNSSGQTGFNGLATNVQLVRYSAQNVYISCTGIPGYDIGPWPGNPNTPTTHNFVFRIPRIPQRNDGAQVATPLGHVGVWTNGVSIFNAKDARSYNNAGIWNQNAVVVEGPGFDNCLGHPAPGGEYHHHLNPRCLYNDADSSVHSPIIGYAFDGFPIYGAYGFRNSDGSGGVTRMRSGYRIRLITERTTRPDGSDLQPSQYGPAVTSQYPRGYYCEDFEYAVGIGDLDEHNGRYCVTPDYPAGTYAYFVTLDEAGDAAYPYTLGPTYYGVVAQENIGPGSGHATPSEPVDIWTPAGVGGEHGIGLKPVLYPNPATTQVVVQIPETGREWEVVVADMSGRQSAVPVRVYAGQACRISLNDLPAGLYVVTVRSNSEERSSQLVIRADGE